MRLTIALPREPQRACLKRVSMSSMEEDRSVPHKNKPEREHLNQDSAVSGTKSGYLTCPRKQRGGRSAPPNPERAGTTAYKRRLICAIQSGSPKGLRIIKAAPRAISQENSTSGKSVFSIDHAPSHDSCDLQIMIAR